MNPKEPSNPKPRPAWPGRKIALCRIAIIALVLFPCTWIADALLVKNWNILENHDAESFRHLREAATAFVAAVCIVFLLTLLPSVHAFFRRLFNWRNIRPALIVCAWLVTLIALLYGEEDWRGRHAWNNYSAQLKTEGDELDLKAFIPPPIPDSENFAANPEAQGWFGGDSGRRNWFSDDFARAQVMAPRLPSRRRQFMDLVGWKRSFEAVTAGHTNSVEVVNSGQLDAESRAKAAPAILEALKPIEGRFDELREAARRPDSHYPIVYNLDNPWGILLPHLNNIQFVCQRLQLRACAELAGGKSDAALADVELMLRLSDSLKSEPFVISFLMRPVTLQLAMQPIWEGLAEHRWSDGQLKEIEDLLAPYDFIGDMQRPLACERSAGILTADLLARGKARLNDLLNDINPPGVVSMSALGAVMPRGWYDMEKVNYCRLFNLQLHGAFDITNRTVSPEKLDANLKAVEAVFNRHSALGEVLVHHDILARLLLPALSGIPKKAAFGQVAADEARIACALERYRLARNEFPKNLDALTPEFIANLPHDPISGEPYQFQLEPDGRFVLSSVGWEKAVNGGEGVNFRRVNFSAGDWSWEYPAR